MLMPRGFTGKAPGEPQAGQADRQVDQKDRAPADQRDQSAADERAGGQRKARARGPDPDRASPRLLVFVGMAEQRQRVRHQDGRGQPLHAAGGDQRRRIRRDRAANRCRGEDGKPGHEDALGADPVAERARGQDEGRKGNRIGADHPLQFGNVAAERGADRIERRVHDGDVELHDAIAETHRGERQRRSEPARLLMRRCAPVRRHMPDVQGCLLHGLVLALGNQCET
ncbi:hypothetical protein ABIF26_000254 [Bradyrhizobium elkanii]